jgi:hypothetical protein
MNYEFLAAWLENETLIDKKYLKDMVNGCTFECDSSSLLWSRLDCPRGPHDVTSLAAHIQLFANKENV